MKNLPSIQSVQSRVRYEETDLKQIITRQAGKSWFWKKHAKKQAGIFDGYASLSTYSGTIPLRGIIEIAFLAGKKHTVILQVPSSTLFFITCFGNNDSDVTPAFAISLS